MKDTRDKARLADNLLTEASESLSVTKGRNKELALNQATADRDRRSVEDGLRNAEAQTEEQR